MNTELATLIRAWRDRVQPIAVGMPAGGVRKSPGLRREELAALAGISVDYLVRLEQGRAQNPSGQVLASLARALRLSDAERDALFRAGGIAPPGRRIVSRHPSPGLQRILDRLVDTPVGLFAANWDLVEGNTLWGALFGSTQNGSGRQRNLAWRHFTQGPSIVLRTDEENTAFGREMAADLQAAMSAYSDDEDLASLVADLREIAAFERLWGSYEVALHVSERKTIDSPIVGLITLDCDVLRSNDSDLRLVVYTAQPGSVDAEKLELLRIEAIHAFSTLRD